MTKEELEFLKIELEKCIRKQELKFKITRKVNDTPYQKNVSLNLENDNTILIDWIKTKEKLTNKGSCLLILNDEVFNFLDPIVQEVWVDTYKIVEEDIFLNDLYYNRFLL